MDVRILGPLEVSAGRQRLPLGGAKQRALLAMLVVHANEVVSKDRLVEELWAGEPFDAAVNALQVTVSRLRKALQTDVADSRLVTHPPGYLLRVADTELDAAVFERLLSEGRSALAERAAERATDRLRQALALWRGPPLADFSFEPFAQHEIARLEGLRLVAVEERIEAELAMGGNGHLTAELEALVGRHPLRERFRGQLMLSLYRSGRQADALTTFDQTRELLAEELGLEPGPELQRLQRAILRQEPQLELMAAREPAEIVRAVHVGAQPRVRKTVTVLSSMVCPVGGRDLDTEALEGLRARGFETAAGVLRRHGAVVQPPVGDALVATFGIPETNEDDVLRALRAGVDLQATITDQNVGLGRDWGVQLAVRSGVHTGEVVMGGEAPLTGGLVSAATRLANGVGVGEVALAEATRRLAQHAVRVEPQGDGAWRLVELVADAAAIPRTADSPLVGRGDQLSRLEGALARAQTRTPQLLTVLGDAGIGKTRLVQEFAAQVGPKATVLAGRCLSYGEAITFSPLREIVRQAAGGETQAQIRSLLADAEDAEAVAVGVAAAIGTSDAAGGLPETSWAFRRLLERLARTRPLVVVFDDVHWAKPALLELIDNVVGQAGQAPILLLCLARPELLDTRPDWGGEQLLLAPLAAEETDLLIDNLLGAGRLPQDARSRIVATAEGNPLFIEQVLVFLADDTAGQEEVPLPPTIQALLAARLDRLGPGERAAIEPAAVIGKEFWRDAVADLVPEEAKETVGQHLRTLVRKQLAEPARSSLPGEDAFRFGHVLIQEATYRSVSKQRRAELHERFAEWLERTASEAVGEHEETLGFHLERAHHYRVELGPMNTDTRELAVKAAQWLGAAGRQAFSRCDVGAAKSLLSRAAALLEERDPVRLELLVQLAGALIDCGDFDQAEELLEDVAAVAGANPRLEAHATLARLRGRMPTHPEVTATQIAADLAQPMAIFAREGDDAGLAAASALLGKGHWRHGHAVAAAEAFEETIVHARRAGDRQRETDAQYGLCVALRGGATPVDEAIDRCEALVEQRPGVRMLEAGSHNARAALESMRGRFPEARAHCERAVAIVDDLGHKILAVMIDAQIGGFWVERLAGDTAAAEDKLRHGLDELGRRGETSYRSTTASRLAQVVYAKGRYDEAEALTTVAQTTAAADDIDPQIRWRQVRAKVLARRGAHHEAEQLAREAVALASETDFINYVGDALVDLAEVLSLGGRPGEVRPHLEEAVRLYLRKGNVVQARWTRALLAELRHDPPL